LVELLESEFAGARQALEHGPFAGLDERHLESSLLAPLRDFLARPGKEFRARVVECAYSLAGGKGAPPTLLPWIVELLHAGSLIVDDIEDGSPYRRGQPALHVRYGLPVALNAGNWLYFWAESLVEHLEVPPHVELSLHRTVNRALLDCHRGQALDLTLRMSQLAQAEVPVAVATTTALKTGRLMELAASLGAITAGAPAERVSAIAHFARDLGTSLQMLDDVGGLYSASRTHKGHEDLRLSRPTWPWAWLAETLSPERYHSLRREALEVEMGDRHPEHLAEHLRAELGGEPKSRAHERSMRAIARLKSQLGSSAALRALCAEIGRLERSYD
jgi:geranylgeranyl pyrophosphate synthase